MSPQTEKKLIDDVAEIKAALLGNDKYDIKGLVFFTLDHRKRIVRIERVLLMGSGAAAVILGIYAVVKDVLPFFLKP